MIWFIEIQHPLDGRWTRVGKPYREKANARSWVSFVRAYWHGAKARVVKVKLEAVMATKEQTLIAALTNEVKAWREADLYCDLLGYCAGDYDPNGVPVSDGVGEGHREVIRMAIAASDAAGLEVSNAQT